MPSLFPDRSRNYTYHFSVYAPCTAIRYWYCAYVSHPWKTCLVHYLFIRTFFSHWNMHFSLLILRSCIPVLSGSSTLTPFIVVVLAPYYSYKAFGNDHQFHSSWLHKARYIVLFLEGVIRRVVHPYVVTLLLRDIHLSGSDEYSYFHVTHRVHEVTLDEPSLRLFLQEHKMTFSFALATCYPAGRRVSAEMFWLRWSAF